jgi:hypothetical protein
MTLKLTQNDRGFLAAMRITTDAPVTRQRLESQVHWLYEINQELSAEATQLRQDAERYMEHRRRMRHQRLCLFALLLLSWAFNLRSLMQWAAAFRLP